MYIEENYTEYFLIFFWPCISVYLFININQLDALNFIIILFQASIGFEHMCSKHIEAWNKLIIKFSASSWLILINKYTEYDHSIGAYSKLSTRSRCRLDYIICVIRLTKRSSWKFRICTYTMFILRIVFLYIYFCELKMAHSGRNMSSST